MSLRYKILIAITAIMILILGVLSANLWYHTLYRAKVDRTKMAEFTRRVVQDWLAEEPENWSRLKAKLNASALLSQWVIVDDKLNYIVSSAPVSRLEAYQEDKDLAQALRLRIPIIKENEVSAFLDLPNGKVVGIKMEIQRPSLLEFSPMESVKPILWIMPIGTIVLIVSLYILLTKLVLKPIESLAEISSRIAEGADKVELPRPRGRDEVARLINTFNSMIEEIREYQGNLESKIKEARHKIKVTEEQLIIAQRLSATGTLAAGIAHEINNPLGGILNAARALKGSHLNPQKTQEYLNLIISGLTRIEETLKKMLHFFTGRLVPQPVDLKSIIERALLLIQYRIETNRIIVHNTLPANLPVVYGESSELQQVFLNLLLNALDATISFRSAHPDHPERGKIEISYLRNAKNVTVTVKDDGVGMTKEELARAFDLFYTTKEPGKGTGLGLSVAHNIITNHGGKLLIESQPEIGTTVKVILPILKKTVESLIEKPPLSDDPLK